jgi:hypothetical protein
MRRNGKTVFQKAKRCQFYHAKHHRRILEAERKVNGAMCLASIATLFEQRAQGRAQKLLRDIG